MINKQFEKILQLLRAIEPDRDFLARSKQLILSTAQEPARRFSLRFFEGVSFQTAFAFASVFLVVLIGGLTYLNSTTGQLTTSFNNDALVQEVRSVSFEIQIAEAQYYDDSAEVVALALDKISGEQNLDTDNAN